MYFLQNKVIIVTGSSGLLGQDIVQSLRIQGAIVYEADINFKEMSSFCINMDITCEESVKEAVKKVLDLYGTIDGWVNNAYPRTKDWGNNLENISIESWRKNVDMHMNGYFICSRIILEQMKIQKFGSLINMSSIYGLVAPDFTVYNGTEMTMPAAYAAIKGGLINLTRYFASYYGPFQVRANCISPGGIFDYQSEIFINNYCNKVPMKRMGSPKDISPAVNYLLSDGSSYLTGQNIIIDGGWSII
jgi:NAD(P)-dependent dehydrogenase (short-subunit alcohol dehydrogenase family)